MHKIIRPVGPDRVPMDPVKVICATLNGKLALHRTPEARGYTLTHVPTGYALRQGIRNKRAAENVMLQIENLFDWGFRVPKSKKWMSQMEKVKPFVFCLPMWD